MKKLLSVVVLAIVLSPIAVSADDTNTDSTTNTRPAKVQMMEKKEEMKAMKMDMKADIKENRMEAKENRQAFRDENKDLIKEVKASLTDEQREQLKDLKADFTEDMDALKEALRESESEEEREEIREDIKQLAEDNFEQIQEIVGENDEAIDLLAARKNVWNENHELRKDNREMRIDYKEVRRDTVEKYRTAFAERLENNLENIPTEKLEEIVERIDGMIEKFENNETISEERKEAMLGALMAIKELVEEELEGDDAEDEILETMEDLLEE